MFTNIIAAFLGKFNILGFFARIRVYLIVAAAFALVIGIAYSYYNYSQNKIEALNKQVISLQFAKQVQDQTIQKLTDRLQYIQKANDDLVKKFATIEQNTSKLSKFFNDHDLDKSAKAAPGLVEKRVNDAVKKLLNDFEAITQPGGF